MLSTLRVKNLAIVDHIQVEFGQGLNVITGETGAGKSMLADALNLVLGERADKSIIRAGEAQCQVEALFLLHDTKALDAALEEAGLAPCEDGTLIIRRIIAASGAGKIVVNDSPASLQILKRLGTLLVDMHGPHEHQSLLDPAFQRDVLDAYGHLDAERTAYSVTYRALLDLQAERARLDNTDQNVAEQIDMLSFQIKELETADLEHTDEETLLQEHTQIANSSRIVELADGIRNALTEDDASAFNTLAFVRRSMPELAALIPEGREWQTEIESITIQIQELTTAIGSVVSRIESDPDRMQWIEDRISLLQKLKRKYGSNIPAMLHFLNQARQKYTDLEGRGIRITELDTRVQGARQALDKAGKVLSQARSRCSATLAEIITGQLRDLGFAQARFTISVKPIPVPSPTGLDCVDFGFAPNVGEPLRSLKDIASSGEISRVMLAVKAVLARHDSIPVLVFDEIDANLGGEMGNAVGTKLATVAVDHQVICITHLPQVAVHGTTHFVVTKAVSEGRTRTAITQVKEESRAEEIARMLGGKNLTSVTLQHAREMLHSSPVSE